LTKFRSIAERPSPLWALGTGLLLAVLLMALVSCRDTTPEQRIAITQLSVAKACDAYAGALNVLAPQRAMGVLSAHEVELVDNLNTSIDPICTAKTPPADPSDAIDQVGTAVTQVMAIYASHEKKGL
jgi:hypothetical protein